MVMPMQSVKVQSPPKVPIVKSPPTGKYMGHVGGRN
jgi:hypothetical protein